MPKGKIQLLNRNQLAVSRTSKIGGRKSIISANMLSADDLRKHANKKGGKDRQKARKELNRRGLPYVVEVETEAV